jgi:hypothetical protein
MLVIKTRTLETIMTNNDSRIKITLEQNFASHYVVSTLYSPLPPNHRFQKDGEIYDHSRAPNSFGYSTGSI